EQARTVVVLGLVGNVLLPEVRHVVALELDESAALELVEGADDTCAAQVDGPEADVLGLVVVGVSEPTVVERGLRLVDDLADRSPDRRRAPGLVNELLVALRIEKHG